MIRLAPLPIELVKTLDQSCMRWSETLTLIPSARGIQASEDQAPFITDVALTIPIAWCVKLPRILSLNATLMSTKRKEYFATNCLYGIMAATHPIFGRVVDYCLRPLDWSNKSHNHGTLI